MEDWLDEMEEEFGWMEEMEIIEEKEEENV